MFKELKSSVRRHSKKQLEIKVEYPLDEKVNTADYQLDFYFFFPSQLHVNSKRVGSDNFLNNMQINTRFSSPLMPLEKVFDTDFHLSPLIRIENILSQQGMEDKDIHSDLLYELQVLCNLYRAETRNFVTLMKKEISRDKRDEICRKRIGHMLETIKSFISRFRKLHEKFLDPHIHEDHRTALYWADESISIITENAFISLYKDCWTLKDSKELISLIEEIIENEVSYRKSMNYQYQYNKEDSLCGETMAYRENVLKKWSQSAMYMNKENSQAPKRIGHLIAGTAAATAMFFAVFVTIYAENFFPKNSTSWILIIVLSYVFKDRIKEILRHSFGNMMPRLTSDQQSNLFDPAHKTKAGKSTGTLRFTNPTSISSEIQTVRYKKQNPFRKILPPNDVVHYKRVIKIKPALLKKSHSRLDAITEIIRFQIDPWLKEMDDSQDKIYRLEEGKTIPLKGSRLYRIHLIIRLREQNKKKDKKLYHYNLNLNKSGIVRIKKVEL